MEPLLRLCRTFQLFEGLKPTELYENKSFALEHYRGMHVHTNGCRGCCQRCRTSIFHYTFPNSILLSRALGGDHSKFGCCKCLLDLVATPSSRTSCTAYRRWVCKSDESACLTFSTSLLLVSDPCWYKMRWESYQRSTYSVRLPQFSQPTGPHPVGAGVAYNRPHSSSDWGLYYGLEIDKHSKSQFEVVLCRLCMGHCRLMLPGCSFCSVRIKPEHVLLRWPTFYQLTLVTFHTSIGDDLLPFAPLIQFLSITNFSSLTNYTSYQTSSTLFAVGYGLYVIRSFYFVNYKCSLASLYLVYSEILALYSWLQRTASWTRSGIN